MMDGLYIGDALTSLDLKFLTSSKISRIVNCAGLESENKWQKLGLSYLTFEWDQNDGIDFNFLESKGFSTVVETSYREEDSMPCVWIHQLVDFVSGAINQGDGVLIHSTVGSNRACSCVLAFLMFHFVWDLNKAISFLQRKRLDLNPSPSYYKKLVVLSDWLGLQHRVKAEYLMSLKYHTWELNEKELLSIGTHEEVLLQNTYLNSEYNVRSMVLNKKLPKPTKKRVQWVDSEERITKGHSVILSPFSKKALPERPPGPCYTSMKVTGGWTDTKATPPEMNLRALRQRLANHGLITQSKKKKG